MSAYPAFEIVIDNDNGSITKVPNQIVKVYNVTAGAALPDTASDAQGTVPGASVAPAPGTRLRFSVARADGLNGCAEEVTI